MKSLLLVLFLAAATSCNEEALKSFLRANEKFRFDLYKQVSAAQEGNAIWSPFSITFLLVVAYYGANSSTLNELRNVLQIPQNHSEFEAAVHHLQNLLKGNEHFKFHALNKVYAQEGFQIKDKFLSSLKNVIPASVESIDFLQPDGAAYSINDWGNPTYYVDALFDAKDFNSDKRLLLGSAVHFKANWLQQFPPSNTQPLDFHFSQSQSSKVDTMGLVCYCYYLESSEVDSKVAELEFGGGEGALGIILPNQRDGLKNLEAVPDLYGKIRNFTWTRLEIELPKFQIYSSIKLKQILKNLGIVTAFSEDADFSGIAGNPKNLFLHNVLQKAYINVDEYGVSGVEGQENKTWNDALGYLYSDRVQLIKNFVVDHPFLFYVKIRGTVLLAGRVVSPGQVN